MKRAKVNDGNNDDEFDGIDKSLPDKKPMSYSDWFSADAETMAAHISLNPAPTEYERENKKEKKVVGVDRTAGNWME